jgi:N6-L-threonylcarbamoyladenine synthase
LRILGIETSCDETSAAVVDGGRVLSNIVSTQVALHAPFAGVVPELASRAHLERLPGVVRQALEASGSLRPGDPFHKASLDAVAFTRGPGLAGALLVGKVAAETLARSAGLPVLGVHHLEGHVLAAELEGPLDYPALALIVSGGHTDLVWVRARGKYRVLGRTRDDAAGEAFDKVAKVLKLGYPGGPVVERTARGGDPGAVAFPRPMLEGSWDFSFSGLKTSVVYHLRDAYGLDPAAPAAFRPPEGQKLAGVCASFQDAVVETLVEKTRKAVKACRASTVVIGGGVAANGRLRERMAEAALKDGFKAVFPRLSYCTDNGAMIAQVGLRRIEAHRLPRRTAIDPNLPFESWNRR